jgi:hypothetical protein
LGEPFQWRKEYFNLVSTLSTPFYESRDVEKGCSFFTKKEYLMEFESCRFIFQGKSLSYFGTGESFLFSLYPKQRLYSWIGLGQSEAPPRASSLFMAADATSLIIGGGGGFALRFDSTLAQGRTEPCTTFASPCLCSNGKEDFECSIVEAFGFIG